VQTARETERKYEAADDVALPDPGELLDLDTGSGPEDHELDAVYFDTPDLRLARARITLRRREGGPDAGWHLKLPAGEDSREELRLPLGRAKRQPPAGLVSLVRVHTRGAELTPVARLQTHRRSWLLADADGRPVAELVEDRVQAGTTGQDPRELAWRELEVELTEHGSPELLDRIEERLRAVGVQRSASPSKLRRVLGDRLGDEDAEQPTLGPDSSAGEVLLAYLRTQVGALRGHDPLVRRDAPDAVHKMRVASRRMRSALQAYRRVLDRDATGRLIEELKWLAAELAPARDSEVMAERFIRMVAELPAELVLGPVAAQVERVFGRRQADAREQALTALDSERYLALQNALDQLFADPPLTGRAGRPAVRELPRGVRRSYRRTARRMQAVSGQPAGEQRDLALHETRKGAKRLRYATEAAAPAVGPPAERMRKRLKRVQKLLGNHQDAVVARPVLRELGAQTQLDGGNGFTFGLLHAAEAARADRAEQRLPDRWQRASTSKVTRWLRS
jgi:CHAD domain-containing protein